MEGQEVCRCRKWFWRTSLRSRQPGTIRAHCCGRWRQETSEPKPPAQAPSKRSTTENTSKAKKPSASLDLGFAVTDVLRKYCPAVVSVEFTRKLEEEMDAVQQGTANQRNRSCRTPWKSSKTVTAELEGERTSRRRTTQPRRSSKPNSKNASLGMCPTCKTGKLAVIYSKKTGKRFAGCTNYFNGTCKTAYPLPQKGIVKPTGKTCSTCGAPTVYVWLRGKRPWNLCLNPACHQKPQEAETEFSKKFLSKF